MRRMAVTVHLAQFGPEATAALAAALADGRGDDPLAPATVVVDRSPVGLALRRSLADRPGGLVNVRFVTLERLADEVGGAALAAQGRRPLSPSIRQAAVRAALRDVDDGLLSPVRHHVATERAVVGLVRELRAVDDAELRALARGKGRPAAAAALVLEVRRRLAGWYDGHELLDAASQRLRREPTAAQALGSVVVHLPQALAPAERSLVDALAAATALTVVLGTTGDAEADAATIEQAGLLGGAQAPAAPDAPPPTATEVVSAPDADAEVLLAVRHLSQRAADGVALERMALVHGGVDPYPRIVHEALAQAGLPAHGTAVRSLADTMTGRTLLGALALPDADWRRDDVIAWFSSGPIRDAQGFVPAARFDRTSRQAGVVAGLDDWRTHLAVRADDRRARLDELPPPADDDGPDQVDAARRERVERDLVHLERLSALIDELADELSPDPAPSRWVDWVAWARRFLRRHLVLPDEVAGVEVADEHQAAVEVDDELGRLAELDELDPAPDLARFRRALDQALSRPAPSTSRFGRGVLVGPVEAVAGLDLDVVVVVGMVEGIFPMHRRDDVLLPDAVRTAVAPGLPRRAVPTAEARRRYLAALAAAPERVVSFARADPRRGRVQRPSRWLLDSVAALEGKGRTVYSRHLPELGEVPGFRTIPSWTAAVADLLEPISPADRDLRSLSAWFRRYDRLDDHPLAHDDPVLRRGLLVRHERRRPGFTRFDGDTSRVAPGPANADVPSSPTRLEQYATCPRRYLVGQVLGVRVLERPEQIERLSPRDRGSLVHAVLERFLREEVARPADERIRPGADWSDERVGRLHAIADEVCREYEARGLTGRTLLWELDRATVHRELERFLAVDTEHRRTSGAVPEAVEFAFGGEGEVPVEVGLPGGRGVRFRGVADRLDRSADGRAWVIDYKTGSGDAFKSLESGDPVARGTKLQLPMYGLAARARFGPGPVHASYWFLSRTGPIDGSQIGYDLDEPVLDAFGHALDVIVGGIERGAFPARPGRENERYRSWDNCLYCDFDSLCPTDRDRAWQRVRDSEVLADYVELAEEVEP
jgi:RecB family exonuclease